MAWDDDDIDETGEGPQPCDLEAGDDLPVVHCPECGHEMVDEAEVCPNCGCWVRSGEFRAPPSLWLVGLAVAAIAGIVAWTFLVR